MDIVRTNLKISAGLLLVDKEAGNSSAQVVGVLKRRLKLRKIGHAGTLDPDATGLLICLVEGATRLAAFAEGGRKSYTGIIQFGVTTSTDDCQGEVLARSEAVPDFVTISECAKRYVGVLNQVPPQVSAVKLAGERAYDLVRKGVAVQLRPREVEVYSFGLTPLSRNQVAFEVVCSKGTYIRSIARDLGRDLGCGGCLAALRRTASFPFSIDQAKKVSEIDANSVISWRALFPEAELLSMNSEAAQRLHGGDERVLAQVAERPELRERHQAIYFDESDGTACGLLVQRAGRWQIAVNI